MGDNIIKSFTITPQQARHCDRCNIIVAPDRPNKSGINVVEGPCIGFFHNSACYNAAREEMEKAQGLTPIAGQDDDALIHFGDETKGLE
jgi:hypothetical protein